MAHLAVADLVCELRQRRDGGAHDGAGADGGVRAHRADAHEVAVAHDGAQLRDAAQVDQRFGRGQPQLHRRQQGLAAGEYLGAGADSGQGIGQLAGRGVLKRLHAESSLACVVLVRWGWARARFESGLSRV